MAVFAKLLSVENLRTYKNGEPVFIPKHHTSFNIVRTYPPTINFPESPFDDPIPFLGVLDSISRHLRGDGRYWILRCNRILGVNAGISLTVDGEVFSGVWVLTCPTRQIPWFVQRVLTPTAGIRIRIL